MNTFFFTQQDYLYFPFISVNNRHTYASLSLLKRELTTSKHPSFPLRYHPVSAAQKPNSPPRRRRCEPSRATRGLVAADAATVSTACGIASFRAASDVTAGEQVSSVGVGVPVPWIGWVTQPFRWKIAAAGSQCFMEVVLGYA